MLMILQTEREAVVSVSALILGHLLKARLQHLLNVSRFGPGHISGLLQTHPEAIQSSKRCSCAPKTKQPSKLIKWYS